MSRDDSDYIDVPCQNCRKIVSVKKDFYGCGFCSDCMLGESYLGN